LAMQTDSTRVLTYALCDSGSPLPESGVTESHHGLSHHGENEDKKKKLTKVDQFHVRQLAYFLKKLKETSDGAGDLLDHSMVLYGSGMGNASRHSLKDLPILLAGHGGGELKHLDSLTRSLVARLGSSARYPKAAAALSESVARACGLDYLEALQVLSPSAARVTDKLPTNFAHLGFAAAILPGTRIIHCVREPMALCMSIFEQQFAEGHQWAYDLDDIALFLHEHRRLMEHWRQVLPLAMLEVGYEDLVRDQEQSSRQLVAFCGLDWDDRCLEFHRVERKVDTASNWQVRQPLYATSVDRWRHFGEHLEPLRQALAAQGLLSSDTQQSTQ
jgi:hypothetical protein